MVLRVKVQHHKPALANRVNKEPREPMERKVLKVKLVPKEKRDLLDLQEIREMMEHWYAGSNRTDRKAWRTWS